MHATAIVLKIIFDQTEIWYVQPTEYSTFGLIVPVDIMNFVFWQSFRDTDRPAYNIYDCQNISGGIPAIYQRRHTNPPRFPSVMTCVISPENILLYCLHDGETISHVIIV